MKKVKFILQNLIPRVNTDMPCQASGWVGWVCLKSIDIDK